MSLNATLIGQGRPDLVFLHGLFGQGKNWTSVARRLEPLATSLLIDLPNHGKSPWTDHFSYEQMADEVAYNLRDRLGSAANPVIIGHSMGGKVAMTLALRHQDVLRGLVVVDIAPDNSSHGYGFATIVAALQKMDVRSFQQRDEAHVELSSTVPSPTIRSFLLQNLRRRNDGMGYCWQFNLDLICEALPLISGWPELGDRSWDGPVLWIRGAHSEYVRPEHFPAMMRMFPQTALLTIEDAGHWVHSEKPDEVEEGLRNFLLAEKLVVPPDQRGRY